jgi:mannobiose 2-epimerase
MIGKYAEQENDRHPCRHVWIHQGPVFGNDQYKQDACGFYFLREKMWDKKFGGFFQIRSRDGSVSDNNGWLDEKRLYGNAFGIYGLAALYEITQDEKILHLAKNCFYWIEEHSGDWECNGYFQFLTREGVPFNKNSDYKTSVRCFGNRLQRSKFIHPSP